MLNKIPVLSFPKFYNAVLFTRQAIFIAIFKLKVIFPFTMLLPENVKNVYYFFLNCNIKIQFSFTLNDNKAFFIRGQMQCCHGPSFQNGNVTMVTI